MHDGHAPTAAHPGVLKLERDKGRSRGGPLSVACDVQHASHRICLARNPALLECNRDYAADFCMIEHRHLSAWLTLMRNPVRPDGPYRCPASREKTVGNVPKPSLRTRRIVGWRNGKFQTLDRCSRTSAMSATLATPRVLIAGQHSTRSRRSYKALRTSWPAKSSRRFGRKDLRENYSSPGASPGTLLRRNSSDVSSRNTYKAAIFPSRTMTTSHPA